MAPATIMESTVRRLRSASFGCTAFRDALTTRANERLWLSRRYYRERGRERETDGGLERRSPSEREREED